MVGQKYPLDFSGVVLLQEDRSSLVAQTHIRNGQLRLPYSEHVIDIFDPSLPFINDVLSYPYFIIELSNPNHLVSIEDIFHSCPRSYRNARFCDGEKITMVEMSTLDQLFEIEGRLGALGPFMMAKFIRDHTLLGAASYADKPLWVDETEKEIIPDHHTATLAAVHGNTITQI